MDWPRRVRVAADPGYLSVHWLYARSKAGGQNQLMATTTQALGDPITKKPPVSVAGAGAATLILLSFGHFFVDLYSGAVGALQPLFVERLGLTLTQAGILGGVFVITSSVVQLAFGYLSDRLRTRWFAAVGPAIAGICISALGMAPAFSWLLALVALGGVGIASFHPQASSTVALSNTKRRGGWMAVFISAGTLGFALGPTYFSQILKWFGVSQMIWAAIPGILVSAFLLRTLPAPPRRDSHDRSGFDFSELRAFSRPLTLLFALVFIRSILQIVFAQFLTLYLSLERGYAFDTANYALTAYLVAGALGGFIGGHLSDRLGGRTVILISMAGSVPFMFAFFLTDGLLSLVSLAVGGLILLFTIPVNVVMAQQLVPSQAGTISAIMMGFAWGTAGMIFIPLTGRLADSFGLHPVLMSLSIFPAIGFLLALKLEKQ
jgi:MFS transporter, FSR family, fosmidomycin resistance protein